MAGGSNQPGVHLTSWANRNDRDRAGRAARRFRDLGLSPIPSREDKKGPALASVAPYRTNSPPPGMFDRWPTSNIQLLTGVESYGTTKILVVDCDGVDAYEAWLKIVAKNGGIQAAWRVRTGGGGSHLYFRIPCGQKQVTTGMIWGLWDTFGNDGKGGWKKHHEIKILGDGALAVAPPSIHVDTKIRYEFEGFQVDDPPNLTDAPAWLLNMPRLRNPFIGNGNGSRNGLVRNPYRREFSDGLPNKVDLACSVGLRIAASSPNAAGWLLCHAIDREDVHPSASFHPEIGVYKDFRDGTTIQFFELIARLGGLADWQEARKWCESQSSPYREVCDLPWSL